MLWLMIKLAKIELYGIGRYTKERNSLVNFLKRLKKKIGGTSAFSLVSVLQKSCR